MFLYDRQAALIFVAFLLLGGSGAFAQLSGVYSCAKGNPGNAFDYADIGTFFDDLEAQGVGGPVTLEVYDDGGPFTATQSFALGAVATNPPGVAAAPVAGLSLANSLTIRAAAGEHPQVTGSAQFANWFADPFAMLFYEVGYIKVAGLEFVNCPGQAISWISVSAVVWNVRVGECKFHAIGGSALNVMTFLGGSINAGVVENNMMWNCRQGVMNGIGVVNLNKPGIEWIIRHNTILAPQGPVSTAAILTTAPVEHLIGNVIVVSGAQNMWCFANGTFANMYVNANYNVYHVFGGAVFANYGSFAVWQAEGYDAQGTLADPILVNTNPGQEDLHISIQSPARDFVPLLTVPGDIDGDPRPIGIRRDAGADEFSGPEISVEYAAAPVPFGGVFNAGNVPTAGAPFSFTIRNTGFDPLDLTGAPAVMLTPGLNCDAATTVATQPPLLSLASNASTIFTLFLKAAAPGPFDLFISIASNDPARNPFTFTINAVGLPPPPPNLAALALPGGGSTLAGAQNGPFTLNLAPGAPLLNASIGLSDPEGDSITVSAITPTGVAPLGIVAPPIPAPGQPLALTWTGVADAANPPGAYSWTVSFADAVNGTPVQCTVTIIIANPPPQHAIAGATGGDGSAALPYTATFTLGQGPGSSIGLAVITDPNSAQAPGIAAITPGGTNPGAAFGLTLQAGALTAAPLGMLDVPALGVYGYAVTVTDGTSNVVIHVRLGVTTPQQMGITTPPQLPGGVVGQPYAQTIIATGAWGGITWDLLGTLPDGLALTATGDITGTPTLQGQWAFLIRATDTAGQVESRQFQLEVNQPSAPPPQGKASDPGCTIGKGGLLPVALLLALLGARARRRALTCAGTG